MQCQHCHADNQDSAVNCTACGKPLASRKRHKSRKKAGGHNGAVGKESAPVSTALALRPQTLPVAFAAAAPNASTPSVPRKRLPKWQALLAGSGAAALLIFALSGTWRTSPPPAKADMPIADARAVLSDPLPSPESIAAPRPKKSASAPAKKMATAGEDTGRPVRSAKAETHKPTPEHVAKAPAKTPPKAAPAAQQELVLLASKDAGTGGKYAQCLELSSFLRREQCKWQTCNGKWGQDGCPSYSNNNSE